MKPPQLAPNQELSVSSQASYLCFWHKERPHDADKQTRLTKHAVGAERDRGRVNQYVGSAASRQCGLRLLQATSVSTLNPELNPICYLLALLGAHSFLHVCRIRVKLLTFRRLMSYIYIYMEHPFLMFLDHTQRRSTVGRTPLDE